MPRRRISSTPYLIKAKYASTCHCGKAIKPGDECLYFPATRKVNCRTCATSTLDMLADEENYNA